jgi:arginyl-tRNA synthetase
MVELPNGKMKSREGTVVDADELMDEMIATARTMSDEPGRLQGVTDDEKAEVLRKVGLGALKYFILKVDPRKNMLFNPQESIDFNGNTGPFIQYTYARIQSLLRKASDDLAATDYSEVAPNDKEISIIQRLADFGAVVADAGKNYSPALIANYAYELAKEFNQFYHDYSILKEDDAARRVFRLVLSRTVGDILKRATSLLGMEMPERM